MKVVVTGAISGESRQTAETKLREAGALVQSAVGKDTDVLVTGAKVGATKVRKAEALGVRVVSWEDFWTNGKASEPVGSVRVASARQIGPMLAKAGELPLGPEWLYEVKWDGYRCVATVSGGAVTMQSRSGKTEYAEQFPAIAAELAELHDCVLDGELVVLDSDGNSSFESMDAKAGASYVVFDVLEAGHTDLRDLSLTSRREFAEVILGNEPGLIVLSPAFDDGEALLTWARERHVEGIVAKRRSSPYREGSRSGEWIKVKIRCEQEFVVVGWKPGEGAMTGAAGSLLLAVCAGVDSEGPYFRYVGRVGTGGTYDDWHAYTRLTDEVERLPNLDLADAPASELRDVVWVEPELVVQVRFQRWTEDGRL